MIGGGTEHPHFILISI